MNVDRACAMAFKAPELLIERFCSEHKVSKEDAHGRFQETKKFLILCATNRQEAYSPSKKVDLMWHQFILHSRDYFRFCKSLGGYIHHQPSEERQPQCYVRTIKDMPKLFGSIDRIYWAESADCDDCSSTCDCCP